jgi:hypothetical protein
MVGYMSLKEQVDKDFSRGRRRALLRRIGARLRRDTASNGLLCFDEVRKVPRGGTPARVSGHEDRASRTDSGQRRPLF